MARFSCKIETPTGSIHIQEVDEETPEAARRSLEAKGYFVFAVEGSPEARGPRLLPLGRGRVGPEACTGLAEAIALILEDRREDGLRGVPLEADRETVIVN